MFQIEKITKKDVDQFLNSIVVINKEIVISSYSAAQWLVEKYYELIFEYFQNTRNLIAQELLSEALKIAIAKGVLRKDDFFKTDSEVMEILENSKDEEILCWLNRITSKAGLEGLSNNRFRKYIKRKTRIVDPIICVNGEIKRASQVLDIVKRINEDALEKARAGVFIELGAL